MARPASRGPRRHAGAKPPATGNFEPSEVSRQLSALEFAIINLMYGYQRWVEICMEAVPLRGLAALDILVLHAVNHRAHRRRLAEICMVLNIGDSHLVSYALKKLVAAALVVVEQHGRERLYASTPAGDAACLAYRKVRERHLVPGLAVVSESRGNLAREAVFLRTLSGIYDQAGRLAMAESPHEPTPPPVRTKR